MEAPVPRCACGCGTLVARSGRRGPAPQYASATCRKRAERRRRVAEAGLESWPGTVKPPEPTVKQRSADEQVERAILEARTIGFAFMRLGTQARPELAWRCTKMGEALLASLKDTFGKDTV